MQRKGTKAVKYLPGAVTAAVELRAWRAVRAVRTIFFGITLPVTPPLEAVCAIFFELLTGDTIRGTEITVFGLGISKREHSKLNFGEIRIIESVTSRTAQIVLRSTTNCHVFADS